MRFWASVRWSATNETMSAQMMTIRDTTRFIPLTLTSRVGARHGMAREACVRNHRFIEKRERDGHYLAGASAVAHPSVEERAPADPSSALLQATVAGFCPIDPSAHGAALPLARGAVSSRLLAERELALSWRLPCGGLGRSCRQLSAPSDGSISAPSEMEAYPPPQRRGLHLFVSNGAVCCAGAARD